jgi:hypothetical protein
MPDLTAKRTLVKSPPELWEELSEVERLAKHLGAFGEIKITKLEPEHTVAWEGEHASGTVSIEPSGWGTKVTLHAELPDERRPRPEPVAAEPEAEPVPAEPESVAAEPEPGPAEPEPTSAKVEPEPEPPAAKDEPVIAEPVSLPEPKRRGFLGWLFRTRTAPPADAPQPFANEPEPEPVVTEPEPVVARPEPEPVTVEPPPEPVTVEPPPEPVTVEPPPEPVTAESELESPAAAASLNPERAQVVLDEALDALGAAHHRPFSRS